MMQQTGKSAMHDKTAAWLVVIGSTIALIVGNGPILLFTFAVFLKPITDDTGWQRGTMSLGVAVGLTMAGLVTPLVGQFIDRWGVQRVTLIMVTLFAASVAAISLTGATVAVFVALYAVAGLVSSGHAPLPYSKAITAWFDSRRGMALGIAMAGVGVGTALMPQVAGLLVQAFGWRHAYIALGLLTWIIAFPSVLLFVKEPYRAKKSAGTPSSLAVPGDNVGIALRTTDFWMMAVAVLFIVTAVNGVIAHLVALLTDRGMPPAVAARTLIGVGLSTILGRLSPAISSIVSLRPILPRRFSWCPWREGGCHRLHGRPLFRLAPLWGYLRLCLCYLHRRVRRWSVSDGD
jgi:MFS family permease